jgi:fructokinase
VLDPHAIILGGGVGNIDALYTEETRKKITAEIFNPRFETALLKPTLGDSAGVFGAAMLVAG